MRPIVAADSGGNVSRRAGRSGGEEFLIRHFSGNFRRALYY